MGLVAQILNRQDEPPEERGVCQRCGDDYEPYVVALMDNFVTITDWVDIKDEYEWLCRDCLRDEMSTGHYAIWDDPHYE